MKKKVISTLLAVTMVASLLAGCGSAAPAAGEAPAAEEAAAPAEEPKEETAAEEPAEEASLDGGKVYYLNFKPEQAEQWVALGEVYSEQTGVPVTIETAASGTYESTLKSEMAKSEAPTLFQVNGPVGLANWKDYTYDLKDSDIYAQLKSDDFALKGDNEEVYGIAYVIETYGIIYNKALLADYCALDGAVIADVSEINSFDTLKAVAEDMQAKKADLGIEGAFASAGMDASSDWRFKTHLANLPIYYEYENDGMTTGSIKGSYLDNYKAIWDLYINNATCAPSLLSSKTGEDAASEFALGEAVFYQNGTWAYGDIQGNEVADEDLGMLPIYIGAEGEENQGLCTGSENYWCVNSKASEADIQATLDFLSWVISSDEGRTALASDMGFVTPFKTFTDDYLPANPLLAAANESIDAGKTSVAWCFTTMPSEEWKNGVGSALLEYAQGTGDWDKVVTAFVDGWATEYAASNAAAE
ncbi:MAG: ABC transporter substrate-binding protein [Lachnospiraceae bacterium]